MLCNVIEPDRLETECSGGASALRDFEVPLDFGFATSTRATVCGPAGAPAVVVLGGISANRFVARCADGSDGWWASLVREGGGVDLSRFRIVGLDFTADETGRIAPTSAEQAEAVLAALDAAGIEKAHAIVGASYGGMVALAFAALYPERVERIVAISAPACPHPFATGMRELQRRVVDLGIRNGDSDEALSIARGLAMLSYRTADEFAERFGAGIASGECLQTSEPGEYLRARGDRFRTVMTPQRFLSLSASIDRHRVEPESIEVPTLLIGATSDQLVPPVQLEALHDRLGGASELHLLPCLYGHDMFLKEPEALAALVKPFLERGL